MRDGQRDALAVVTLPARCGHGITASSAGESEVVHFNLNLKIQTAQGQARGNDDFKRVTGEAGRRDIPDVDALNAARLIQAEGFARGGKDSPQARHIGHA